MRAPELLELAFDMKNLRTKFENRRRLHNSGCRSPWAFIALDFENRSQMRGAITDVPDHSTCVTVAPHCPRRRSWEYGILNRRPAQPFPIERPRSPCNGIVVWLSRLTRRSARRSSIELPR
jgi:hypothetical protein